MRSVLSNKEVDQVFKCNNIEKKYSEKKRYFYEK